MEQCKTLNEYMLYVEKEMVKIRKAKREAGVEERLEQSHIITIRRSLDKENSINLIADILRVEVSYVEKVS